MSSALSAESKKYSQQAKDIHRRALIRKYVPLAVVLLVVLLLAWIRYKFFPGR